jgi:hypothetical protein
LKPNKHLVFEIEAKKKMPKQIATPKKSEKPVSIKPFQKPRIQSFQ